MSGQAAGIANLETGRPLSLSGPIAARPADAPGCLAPSATVHEAATEPGALSARTVKGLESSAA